MKTNSKKGKIFTAVAIAAKATKTKVRNSFIFRDEPWSSSAVIDQRAISRQIFI